MSDDNVYRDGDIVWVKLGTNWWPGEVCGIERQPQGFLKHAKRKPYCVVKFFQEDSFEYVKTSKQIFPYRCSKRDEFVRKGFALYKARNKFMEKFPSDVQIAEGLAAEIYETPSIIINNRPDSIVKAILGQTLVRTSNNVTSNYGRRNNDTITKIINITPTLSSVSNTTTFEDEKVTNLNTSSSSNTSSGNFNNINNTNNNSSINSPNSSIGGNSNLYRCNLCGFTSLRQNVMILHRKTHNNTNNSNNLTPNGFSPQQKILQNSLELSSSSLTPSPSQTTNKASSYCQDNERKENTNEKTNNNKNVEEPLLSASKKKQATTNLVEKKISSVKKTVGGKSKRKSSASTASPVYSIKVAETKKKSFTLEIKDEDSNQILVAAAHEDDYDKSSSISRPSDLERNDEGNSQKISIANRDKRSEKFNGCFNDDSFESKSIVAKLHQYEEDSPENRDSVESEQFTQKRNSEDIRKSLLADWSDEDDHLLEENKIKTNKINVLVEEEIVHQTIDAKEKEILEKKEIFIECATEIEIKYPLENQSIAATQSITAVRPSPQQSKIRNIPKKDRRDIILKEFNNGNCQSRQTSLIAVTDYVETTTNHKKSTDESFKVSFKSLQDIAEENSSINNATIPAPTLPIDASPPSIVSKIPTQKTTTTAVVASTLSCFDFKEEEDDCDSDLLSSIAKFKKKYLSSDKIGASQVNVEFTRKSIEVRSQSIKTELKDKQLSDEIESLLNNSVSAIPITSTSVCSVSENQTETGRNLLIKERGKRIFKSRNRSQLEENKTAIFTATATATTTENVLLPSNEADDQKEKLLLNASIATKYENKPNDDVEKKFIQEEKFETIKTMHDENVKNKSLNNEIAGISNQETQTEIIEDNKEFIETDKASNDQTSSQECFIVDAQRNDNKMITRDNLLEEDAVNDNEETNGTQNSLFQQKDAIETVEMEVKANHSQGVQVVNEEEKFDLEFNKGSVSVYDIRELFLENNKENITESDQQLQHSDQQAERETYIPAVDFLESEQNLLSAFESCEKSSQNEETMVSEKQTILPVAGEKDMKNYQNLEIISVLERQVLPVSSETSVDSEQIDQKMSVAQSQQHSPLINYTEQTTNLHFSSQFVDNNSQESLCLDKNNSNKEINFNEEHENSKNSIETQEENNADELQSPALVHEMEENDTKRTSSYFDSIEEGGEKEQQEKLEQQQPTPVAEKVNDEGCATVQHEDFGGEESIPMIVYSPVEIYGGEVQDQNHSNDGQNDKDENDIMQEHRTVCEEDGVNYVVEVAETEEQEEEEEILSPPIKISITPLSIVNDDQIECEAKISSNKPELEVATSVNNGKFHEEGSVSSPVNNTNEILENRLASLSDENSSVAISEADAEFGSPTSMLDDERMPEIHSTAAAPTEDESTNSCNKENKEEITALNEEHIELKDNFKTVETKKIEISSHLHQESIQSEEVVLSETAFTVDDVLNPSKIQSTDCTSQSEVSKSLDTELLDQRTYTDNFLLEGEKDEMLGDESNVATNVVDENIEDVEEDDEEDEEEEEEEIESPPHEELSDSESRRSEARKLQEEMEKANQKLFVKQRINLIPDATNAEIEVCQQQQQQQLQQQQQEQNLQQQEKLQKQQESSLVNLQRTSPETLLGGEELSAAETLLLIPRQCCNALVEGGGSHIEMQKLIEPPTEMKVETPFVSPFAAKDDCRQTDVTTATTTTNARRKRRSHLKVTPRKRIIDSNQDDTNQAMPFETKVRKVDSATVDYIENATKSSQFEGNVEVKSFLKENEVAAAPVVCGTRTFRPRRVTNYYEGDSQSPTPMEMMRAAAREEAATRKAKRESTKKTQNQQPTATHIDASILSPTVTAPTAPTPAPQQTAFNLPLQQEKVRINVDVANPLSTQLATIFGSRSSSHRSTTCSSGYQESFANKVEASIARKRKQTIEYDIPSFVIERHTANKSPSATAILDPLSQAESDTIAHMQSLCPKLQVTRKEMRDKDLIKTLPKATIATPISTGPPQMFFLNQNPNQNKKIILNRTGGSAGGVVTTNDNISTMLDFGHMPIMVTNDNTIHKNVHIVITPSSAPPSSTAMTSTSASTQQILLQVPHTLTTVGSPGVFINQRQFQIQQQQQPQQQQYHHHHHQQQQQQQQQSQPKSRKTPINVRTKRTPSRQQILLQQQQQEQQPVQIPNPQQNLQQLQEVEQQRKRKTKQQQQDHQIEQHQQRLQQATVSENAQQLQQKQQIQQQKTQPQQKIQQQKNFVEVKQKSFAQHQVNAFNSKIILQQEQPQQRLQPLPSKSNKQMGVDSRGNKYVIIKSDANMILNRTTITDNVVLEQQQAQPQQEHQQIILQSQTQIQSHEDDHIKMDSASNTYNIGSGVTIRPIYHSPAVTPHSNMGQQRKEKSIKNNLTVTVSEGRGGGTGGGIGELHQQHSTLADITVKAVCNQQRQVPLIQQQQQQQQHQQQQQQQQEITITKSQDRNRRPKSNNNSALASQTQVVVQSQSQLQAIDEVATLRRLGATDITSFAPPIKILKSTNSFADALAQQQKLQQQQLVTCSTDVDTQMNRTLEQIDPIIEQQQQEQQIVHSTTPSHQKFFFLDQLNNKGGIIAIPFNGVSEIDPTFVLCREVNNKYIPINDTPLCFSEDMDRLLPLPGEVITDEMKITLEQLQIDQEVDEFQTTQENERSTDSEIHEIHHEIQEISHENEIIATQSSASIAGAADVVQVGSDGGATEQEEEHLEATPTEFYCLPGSDENEIDTSLIQQDQAVSQMVGDAGDQFVLIPPGSPDISRENTMVLDCDEGTVFVDPNILAQLLSNANVNTNLVTTDGNGYRLSRDLLDLLLAQNGMRQADESQQIQIVETNGQIMSQQHSSVRDDDGDVIVTDTTIDATGDVSGGSDILAVALAGSDLYNNDVLEMDPSNGMQLVGTDSVVYQQQQKQHLIGTAKVPITRETTVLNPPIPSTLEIPSSSIKEPHSSVTTHIHTDDIIEAPGSVIHSFSGDLGDDIDDDDVNGENALIMQEHQVPLSVELPITITNPVIARNELTPRMGPQSSTILTTSITEQYRFVETLTSDSHIKKSGS